MRRWLDVRTDGNEPVHSRVNLLFLDRAEDMVHREAQFEGQGRYGYEDAADLTPIGAIVEPYEPGHWIAWEPDFRRVDRIWCPSISEAGHSWWHTMLGRRIEDLERGSRIRIGVVDAGFDVAAVVANITAIDVNGGLVISPHGGWIHGEAICRILADAEAPECCAAIAPGAELFFASATYSQMTLQSDVFTFPLAAYDEASYLDPTLVANAIFEMALNHEVDLINLSAGAVEMPESVGSGLAEAIETATECGSTIVCAAGNNFVDRADFPARHPDCIGVGAFGLKGWGPDGSAARDFNCPSENGEGFWGQQAIFHWSDSAYGDGVDTIGPGVGILIARDGEAAFDLTGTSFAVPIVLGALAVELAEDDTYLSMPRDRSRGDYVRARLRQCCQSTGIPAAYEGCGVLSFD